MGAAADILHHPRRLFLRRAVFQVHLWAGVLLSLYVVAIALSGSVLVFEDELTGHALPAELHRSQGAAAFSPQAVAERFRAEFPGSKASQLTAPTAKIPAYQVEATDAHGRAFRVVADPETGRLFRMPSTWLDTVHDFHLYLLLPHRYGMQVNAVAAAVLMLLTISGLLLWWPGIRTWTRGLRVNLRANWRRVNYDLHSAIGFWTLLIVFWWALSGFYFGFYPAVVAAVNAISPLKNMRAPTPLVASKGAVHLPLDRLLASAAKVSPAGRLYGVSDPLVSGDSVYVYMDQRELADFSHRDVVLLDSSNGRVLSLWHYGANHSAGDWVLWAMHPLHFGTLWGTAVKTVWALLGVSLAVLTGTGLLMYWNRFLRHRWRGMRRERAAPPATIL